MKIFTAAALIFSVCAVQSVAAETAILFDEGHGQQFLAGADGPLGLSGLAEVIKTHGMTVKVGSGKLTDEALSQPKALVISGPFASYSAEEAKSVRAFLDKGGKLAVMLHIGTPVAPLLHPLGVDFSNGVLHEKEGILDGEDRNFTVTRLNNHPVFAGISHFSIYGGWALTGFAENAATIAQTSPTSWVDLNGDSKLSPHDVIASFGVVVSGARGAGRFIVFGDDTLFQNRFLHGNNRILAENLAVWLQSAE